MEKLEIKYNTFVNVLERLNEVVEIGKKESNSIIYDATIQRFEFVIELAWKLMKEYLENENLVGFNTPKMVVKEIYRIGLINNGEIWLDMLNDRNLTSHTYDEETAKKIYINIVKEYIPELELFKNSMKEIIDNE